MTENIACSDPLFRRPDSRFNIPKLFAVDTETSLFTERALGYNKKTATAPFGYPADLILGSIAGEGEVQVLHREELLNAVYLLLRINDNHLVFHNASFDIPMLCAGLPRISPELIRAIDAGRIHDTKILEVLIQIAVSSSATSERLLVQSPRLQDLALARAGMRLDKGAIRVTFAQFKDPAVPIPPEYLEYAAEDAVATYLVFKSQVAEAKILAQEAENHSRYPIHPDALNKWGLLSEKIQVQGALAFAWLEQFPLRVDVSHAKILLDKYAKEAERLEEALVFIGYARRAKKTGEFHLCHKLIREVLTVYAAENGIEIELTDTELTSLRSEFWLDEMTRAPEALLQNPLSAKTTEERIQVWLRYAKVRKILTTYLHVYASSPVHYPRYQSIGARTGRTSASQPSIQQIPKRKDSIRGIFVAQPGHTLIEFDYRFAELVALAEIYHARYGGSSLETAINTGVDPHVVTARRFAPDYDQLSSDEQKHHRSAAKAVNFGLPGGLGWNGLRRVARSQQGIVLSELQSKTIRSQVLASDAQLSLYLDDEVTNQEGLEIYASNLNLDLSQLGNLLGAFKDGVLDLRLLRRNLRLWIDNPALYPDLKAPPGVIIPDDLRRETTRTLTGRIRGRASYTEAHNTPFQGLVSDAGKIALWRLHCAWINTLETPWSPMAFIHDSILIECQDASNILDTVIPLVKECMLSAMKEVCPHVNSSIETNICGARWGENVSSI